jgi:NAD-dependent SIR2 family protein deacetylase
MKVKCNKCGHIGDEESFPHGRDFFQNKYVASCPKCDNRQDPGSASMRAFGAQRPFEYVREDSTGTVHDKIMHNASEAS